MRLQGLKTKDEQAKDDVKAAGQNLKDAAGKTGDSAGQKADQAGDNIKSAVRHLVTLCSIEVWLSSLRPSPQPIQYGGTRRVSC